MQDQERIQLQRQNVELAQEVQRLKQMLAAQTVAAQTVPNQTITPQTLLDQTVEDQTIPAQEQKLQSGSRPRLNDPVSDQLGTATPRDSKMAAEPLPTKSLLQRAVTALQRSEARYRVLLNSHPDPIARCLADGTIAAANSAFVRYFGRQASPTSDRVELRLEHIVGDSLWDVLRSDRSQLDQFEQAFQQLCQQPTSVIQFECRTIGAGQVYWQHWVMSGVWDNQQRLLEVQIVGQDISDRKQLDQTVVRQGPSPSEEILKLTQANQQLQLELRRRQNLQNSVRQSEERYRAIFAALHEGVLVIDAQGQIKMSNTSAAHLLSLTVPELVRFNLFDRRWQWMHENGINLDPSDHPAQITAKTDIPCLEVVLGLKQVQAADKTEESPALWLSVNAQPLFCEGEMLPREVVVSLSDVTARKQAEFDRNYLQRREQGARIQAEQAQEQISQILESVTDGFVAFDRNWRFTYINREAAKTIGRSGKSLLGRVLWQEFPEFAQTNMAELYRQVMREGKATEAVEYYAPCDRWYSVRIYPSVHGLSIYFRNMTEVFQHVYERNQVEADLRDTEERFRQLAENIPQVFWMYDFEAKRLIYISDACKEVFGLEAEQALNKAWETWLKRVHPNDVAKVRKAAKRPFVGRAGMVKYRFTKPDGEVRWLLARAFPVRDGVGKVYRMAGMVEDITDRQQKENWLTLLESVIVNANDAVLITEAEPVELPGPHIVYVNDAFTRMMGYERHEVIGKTPRILQGPQTDMEALKSVREALKRWEPVMVELVNYHKNGSEVWIELSLFPVTDTLGNYNYWVGIQRDVTNRKLTEAEIQRALAKERELSELKSRFVSTTSHEFRTPLSTILSSVDLLEFYAENGSIDRYLEHTQRIQNAALNMNSLLNDILIIERAEANRTQLDPVDLDLRAFCTDLVEEMRLNDQGYHELALQVRRSDGVLDQSAPILAHMDEKLLRQIFTNLLSNALKYSAPGSQVTFRMHCSADQIIIDVADQGIGVPVGDQGRLFEPFHRATNVGAISGTGLGLAIVKQSVEVHRGTIRLRSDVGQGTTVTVTLPRSVHSCGIEVEPK
jgi:PAS domain S-box-containing protein